MSRIHAIIRNPTLFLRRHPRYRKAIVIVSMIMGGCILLLLVTVSQLPDMVWLPDTSKYAAASDNQTLSALPVESETITTKYGRATRYTFSDNWQTLYEFRSTLLLKSASCPNITSSETLLPSACKKIGTFQGQPVYTMHRSLPSGTTEYFVKLDQTFIYIKSSGDGSESLDYLNTFIRVPHDKVQAYLANNGRHVDAIKAKRQAEKEATEQKNAMAYTRLDFTPAIPTNLPSGWQLNTNPLQLDGPDADHPNMINLNYANSNKQYISVHSSKLSNFIVGVQCGPSPGYSMENLPCHKVPGTDYYEAIVYNNLNDFVRYLYRPVGDCLVISQIVVNATGDKRPDFPTELAKIQDAITLSAQPTDKTNLKGSTYYKLYYH